MVICIILMGATVLQSAAHHCALDPVQSGDMIAMLKRVHGRPSHSCHDLPGQLLLVRSHVHLDLTPVLPMRFCDRRDPDLRRTLSESHRSEAEDNKHSGRCSDRKLLCLPGPEVADLMT
jgi:hypothetical protein